MTTGQNVQRNLIIAIVACVFVLVGVFVWFLQVKEEAENPSIESPHVRGADGQSAREQGSDEVDMDKLFEEEKKKQPGLGSLHK